MRPTTSSSSAAAALVGNSKDLVGEILSRLPLSSVVRFRLVCKEWCSLITSTQSFNNNSCFVVQYFKYSRTTRMNGENIPECDHFNTLFFNIDNNNSNSDEDNNSNNTKMMKVVREYLRGRRRGVTNYFHKKRYYRIKLISSYRGLLLFTANPGIGIIGKKDPALIVYNPVTKEQYTVAAPLTTHVYCGFYYHLPTKEYRILYQVFELDKHYYPSSKVTKFLVFGLQTQVMRVLKLQQDQATIYPEAAAFYYQPDTKSTPPVISNGSLHWIVSEHHRYVQHLQIPACSHTILCFGMESEEFRLMPHPKLSHPCNPRGSLRHRHQMNLLEMDGGILCLCDGYYGDTAWPDYNYKAILEIYVMEDYKKWTWVRRYHVDLSNYIHSGCEYGLYYKALQILQGDQLLLHYRPNGHHRNLDETQQRHFIFYHPEDQYALYSLNQRHEEDGRRRQALSSSSSITEMVRKNSNSNNITMKKKKKRQRFQVLIDGYPGDELVRGLRRMMINSKKKKRPHIVKGNMVVLTPSLASFQHNSCSSTAPPPGNGTFSIRTNSRISSYKLRVS